MLKSVIIGVIVALVTSAIIAVVSSCIISPWVTTPAFKEFSEKLDSRLDKIDSRLSRVEGQCEALQKMQTQVVTLQKDMNQVQQSVEDLRPPAQGRFLSPAPNSLVGRHFEVELEVANPRSGRFYWLAIGIAGRFWPKSRLHVPPQGLRTVASLSEGGNPPHGRFGVHLFEVSQEEDARLRRWMEPADGSFPGIVIDGADLASLPLRLQ